MRKAVVAGLGSAFLLVGVFTTPASADVGDGSLGCNTGEICFARDSTNTTYQKHFWYAGWHTNYTFTNVSSGAGGQGAVRDNAYQIKNLDTACTIKVIDDHGILPDDVSSISRQSYWQVIGSSVRDQNDRHERC